MNKLCFLFVFTTLIFFTGCNDCDCDYDDHHHDNTETNKVLMLKLDYSTFALEGYKEFNFNQQTDSFNIIVHYLAPVDFGYIQLIYKELNQQLFYGTEVWDGLGHIIFPEYMDPADELESVSTDDVIFPVNGFINIHPYSYDLPSLNVWLNIQHLEIVRQYLESNPDQKVYILRYKPSQGGGDPLDWDYYIFMRN